MEFNSCGCIFEDKNNIMTYKWSYIEEQKHIKKLNALSFIWERYGAMMLKGRYMKCTLFWSKFCYISINNIFALGFDCSCYSDSMNSNFLYVLMPLGSYIFMSLDYFNLQKCIHRNLISFVSNVPIPTLIKIDCLLFGQYGYSNLI
jgi:hypothetical protein